MVRSLGVITSIVMGLLGLSAAWLCSVGVFFPVWMSVIIFAVVSVMVARARRERQVGWLFFAFWLVYVLPFIHIPAYIGFDFTSSPVIMWGLAVNPYMLQEDIVELTAMIGAVGSLGVGFSLLICGSIRKNKPRTHPVSSSALTLSRKTMGLSTWIIWVAAGVFLTILAAPTETMFASAYSDSSSLLAGKNFSSAWMMSYVILTFAFCDALAEKSKARKNVKTVVIMGALAVVVVYFQLMRGDRESLPWVIGLLMVCYHPAWHPTEIGVASIPRLRLIAYVVCIAVVSLVVGATRHGLVAISPSDAFRIATAVFSSDSGGWGNLLHGTWSAVLLTPLSVAGDDINRLLPLKWGEDYLDLALSIVPGSVADAVGFDRPIDAGRGPAWEMRYGQGGTHATVVPYMNFRMLGVLLSGALSALLVDWIERKATGAKSVSRVSLLVVMIMAIPHWLWYGEKNLLNAIILWGIFSFFYKVSVSLPGQAVWPRRPVSNRQRFGPIA
jgi:hypothetical protein